jgi:hypothetical protein
VDGPDVVGGLDMVGAQAWWAANTWQDNPDYEGLPGVYSTIWYLCYKTNELKKKKSRRGRHWA